MVRFLLAFFICIICSNLSAQYATIGTGNLRKDVWWFDWQGFSMEEGASRTFNTFDGLTVKITFSNVSNAPAPQVMNTWPGAVLHFLYDFNDPNIKPAFYNYSDVNTQYNMVITATRAGQAVPFTFVTADAEASDQNEITELKTNGSNWKTVDFFRNSSQTSNPLTGCGTPSVSITDTYGGAAETGQNPVIATDASEGIPLSINVLLRHNVLGGMALAFGILEPVDMGDLPANYGTAQHQLIYKTDNGCNYLSPLPVTSQISNLLIGKVPGDADAFQTADDNTDGTDEDGLKDFQNYDGSGTYTLNVPVSNTTGTNAFLTGWFDYNRNGIFDNTEYITATIANNATSTTLTWTGLPATLPTGSVTDYAFRFRISSNMAATQAAAGFAPDGEVEDYLISMTAPCELKVSTIEDTSICDNQLLQLKAQGANTYAWHPGAGLSDSTIANPIFTGIVTNTYIVTGTNEQGCIGKDTVKINVLRTPHISLSNDTTICSGTKIQLVASGGTLYKWTPSANLSADDINNPVASPTDTTKYYVNATNANGCSNKDSVVVRIAQKPSVSTIQDTAVCQLAPVLLRTSSSADVSYSWFPGTGLNDSTVANPTATSTRTTDYIITIKNANNCQAKDTVRITTLDLPSMTTSNDTAICVGGKVPLFASGGVQYQWSPPTGLSDPDVNNPIASTDHTTTYHVLVTSANGCSSSDSVKLTTRPVPDFKIAPVAQSVCKTDTITLTASGGDVYSWLNAGSGIPQNNAVAVVKPDTNTIYKVRIYDSVCHLIDTLSSAITVKPLPQISIQKSNDIDCTNPYAQLTATGADRYIWLQSVGLNNSNIANPIVSPDATTTFSVKATNSQGCSSIDSVQVVVKFTGAAANGYLLPTAFTPNNDGKNDCFGIKSWGTVSNLDFSIYNRWGERVFYTANPSECWDGTYKNIRQNTGSFVYFIKAKTVCGGEFSRKGTIVLIR